MGLVEDILERATLKHVLLLPPVLLVSWILLSVLRTTWEDIQINSKGPRPNRVPLKYPFGLDLVQRAVKSTMAHKNLDMWQWIFRSSGGSYTAEARPVGNRIIFTADPENIKAILATQFGDFGKGEPFHREWSEFLGDSIFTTDGQAWHASRQLIRPQFIKDRVSDLQCFESHMAILFKAIANGGALEGEDQPVDVAAGNGKPLDVSDLFFRYTLDVATDFLLGKDVKSLSTPRQSFADAFAEVQRVQNIVTRAGPSVARFVPKKSFKEGLKEINTFLEQYIAQTLQMSPEELESKTKSDTGYTFLHALAGFTNDRKVLRDQLVAVLLAGRDTTASTLSWTIYELARHPDAYARLRDEVLRVVGPNRTPTYEDLKSMKYLQNVMNETLRLYPVVPFNVRMALKDTTLPRGGGPNGDQPVFVYKDTGIGYSTLVMQRRKDLYPPVSDTFPDVDVFSPERWYHWQPKPWQYVPFNGGPRICIGQQFALTEMGYVLTRLVQRYGRLTNHMADIDGGNPTLKAEIVLQPGDGVHVAFWEAQSEKV